MRLMIRAELGKLTALLVLPLLFIACLAAVSLGAMEQNWAFMEKRIVAGIFADKEAGVCRDPQPVCEDAELQAAQDQADRRFAATIADAEEKAARQQTLPGSAAFVAGLFLSSLGLLVAFVLAAVLVAGEWDRGTITPLLLAEARLDRVLLAKATVIWGSTLALYVSTVGVMWGFGAIAGRRLWPVDHALVDWSDLRADALRRLFLVVVVGLAHAVFAVQLASVLRGRVITVLGGAFVVTLMNVLAVAGGPMEWTPVAVIGDLAEFSTAEATWDHISMYAAHDSVHPVTLRAGALVVAFLIVVVVVRFWNRRSDRVE